MARFTPTQGRYLAYIHAYTNLHGVPPAEAEIAEALGVSPPSVNLMIRTLEKKGLIARVAGKARTAKILIPHEDVPAWNATKSPRTSSPPETRLREATADPARPARPEATVYLLTTFLLNDRKFVKFTKHKISRTIEIRGDQTLTDLHEAIFDAYDRYDEHLYEFQFVKKPYDDGPKYGIGDPEAGDAETTTIHELNLKPQQVFGYWFDFGDDWYHQIQVDAIERADPKATYPRVVRSIGESPPQYPHVDEDE